MHAGVEVPVRGDGLPSGPPIIQEVVAIRTADGMPLGGLVCGDARGACDYPRCTNPDCALRECTVSLCINKFHHFCANGHTDPRCPQQDAEFFCDQAGYSAGSSLCYACFTKAASVFVAEGGK
jgi:hypothetical protein